MPPNKTKKELREEVKLLREKIQLSVENVKAIEKEHALLKKITKEHRGQLKSARDILDINRINLKTARDNLGIIDKQKSVRGKLNIQFSNMSKSQKEMLKRELNYDAVSKRVVATAKKRTKGAELLNELASDQIDLAFQLTKNQELVGSAQFESIDLEQHINYLHEKRRGVQQDYIGDNAERGRQLTEEIDALIKQADVSKEISEYQSLEDQATKDITEKIKEQEQRWNNIKAQIMAIVKNPMNALKAGVIVVGAKLVDMVKTMGEFAIETGLSFAQVAKMGPMIGIAGDEAKALMDEFGGISNVTAGQLIRMKLLNWQYGVSGEAQAKLLGVMEATSSLSRSQLMDQIKFNAQLARAAGLAPQAVMEDIAQNTELFAKFGKDGGQNIAEAAIFARKLGMELSDIAGISESLLDWESSIQAEMEAEVLLGRQLNLEKARQLNFNGDLAGMAEEIKKQVGSEAEFNRMNVVQRQALAQALGMNVEQMSKMIREQEHSNSLAKKFKLSWIAIGAAIGAVIGMIVGGLSLGLAIPKMAAGMGKGILVGAGIGSAIGIATAGISAVDDIVLPPGGTKAITAPAGTFQLNKDDTVVAGTNLGGSGGSSEMKELVKLTKQMMEQNKMLMTKLDRSVRGLAAV